MLLDCGLGVINITNDIVCFMYLKFCTIYNRKLSCTQRNNMIGVL